jgi:hypothetical protein
MHHPMSTDTHNRRNTPLTYFPETPDRDRRIGFFSKVNSFHQSH